MASGEGRRTGKYAITSSSSALMVVVVVVLVAVRTAGKNGN